MRFFQAFSLALVIVSAAPAGANAASPYEQHKDIVYGDVDGIGLLMDIFTPINKKNGLGIIDIASGAWYSDRGKIRDHQMAGIYDVACERGYTVFAVRPGSITKFSGGEMLAHVKRGIRFAKHHAKDYGIDPDRLGLTGASAGGHLACLTAVTAEDGKEKAKDPLDRHSTYIKAAGVFFPPTNFLDYGGRKRDLKRLGNLFVPGGIKNQSEDQLVEQAKKMSPALLVSAKAPPFLFIHGDADPAVPLQQSEFMIAALKQAGVSAELIVKKGGGHPWPTIREEVVKLMDWFDKQLVAPSTTANGEVKR